MRRIVALLCVLGLAVVWTGAPRLVAWATNPRVFVQPAGGGQVLSPHESSDATIDGSMISIVYGRPSMRGRKIFGRLVPYGRVWCPGADQATMLTTTRDLQFEGLKLPAGEYSLWMLPTESKWSLTFNTQAHAFHIRRSPQLDFGTVEMHRRQLASPVEQLTFTIEANPSGKGGVVTMLWEDTAVAAPFTVDAARAPAGD